MKQISTKKYQTGHDRVEKGNPPGIVLEIEIWPYEVVYAQLGIPSWKMRHTNFSGILRYRQSP